MTKRDNDVVAIVFRFPNRNTEYVLTLRRNVQHMITLFTDNNLDGGRLSPVDPSVRTEVMSPEQAEAIGAKLIS